MRTRHNSIVIGGLLLFSLLCLGPAVCAEKKYVEDFEFLEKTVSRHSVRVRQKHVDWQAACRDARPQFLACDDSTDHLHNIMKLLAILQDGRSGLRDAALVLPSPGSRLQAGGMRFRISDGRVLLAGIRGNHPAATEVPLGATLVAVEGEPIWAYLARLEKTERQWFSIGSQELFKRLESRLLPAEEGFPRQLTFIDGTRVIAIEVAAVQFLGNDPDPLRDALPVGCSWQEGAAQVMLRRSWSSSLGYLRLTGEFDDLATVERALDQLKDAEAMIIDVRGIGGTDFGLAEQLAARFFANDVTLENGTKLAPRGKWQFAGPVVLIQDQGSSGSVEELLRILEATSRAYTIGARSAGNATETQRFVLPSRLATVELVVEARDATIETYPMLLIEEGPTAVATGDLPGKVAEIYLHGRLRKLSAPVLQGWLVSLYGRGNVRSFQRAAGDARFAALGAGHLGDLYLDDLDRSVTTEATWLTVASPLVPDFDGSKRRLTSDLLPRLRTAGERDRAALLGAMLRGEVGKEARLQVELLPLLLAGEKLSLDDRKRIDRHRSLRIAKYVLRELTK